MHVCMQCIHVCGYAQPCVHTGDKRKTLGVLLYHSPPYPLGTGSLIELKRSNFVWVN